jgi:hypothetical protein
MVAEEVTNMNTFRFPEGFIEIDNDGDMSICQGADRVVVDRTAFSEFFEAIDTVRDEVMPPGPIEIPDPVRRAETEQDEPFDSQEARLACMNLSAAVGRLIQENRKAS